MNSPESTQSQDPLASLSPREMEIFAYLVSGQREGIADLLGISTRTLDRDRASLMEKLGVHDLAELVRFAIKPDDDDLAAGPCVVAGGRPRLPHRPPLAAAVDLPRESTFCEAPRKPAANR